MSKHNKILKHIKRRRLPVYKDKGFAESCTNGLQATISIEPIIPENASEEEQEIRIRKLIKAIRDARIC
jgi:hypothetical protein